MLPIVFAGRRLALWYEAGSPYFFGTLALFITLLVLRRRLQKGECLVIVSRRADQRAVLKEDEHRALA